MTIRWTKQVPKKPGLYWCRCSGYGNLYPHGDGETDIICEVDYSSLDKVWTIMELGGDNMMTIDENIGVELWSDEPVERPQEA